MTKPKKVEEPTAAYQPKPSTKAADKPTPPLNDERAKAIAARLFEERKQLLHKLAQ